MNDIDIVRLVMRESVSLLVLLLIITLTYRVVVRTLEIVDEYLSRVCIVLEDIRDAIEK